MGIYRILQGTIFGVFVIFLAVQAGAADVIEKKAALETVKSDLEDGLGLTREQKEKVAAIRSSFKAKQVALKDALNAKYEAMRQELDGDNPSRAKVEPVVADIKALQAQLTDNRVDVVFRLREVYTPQQIKAIKSRLEQQRKSVAARKGKKGKKVKKAGTRAAAGRD